MKQLNIDKSSSSSAMDVVEGCQKKMVVVPRLLRGGVGYGIPEIKPYLRPFLAPEPVARSNVTFRRVSSIQARLGRRSDTINRNGVVRTIVKTGVSRGGPRRGNNSDNNNNKGALPSRKDLDAELDKVKERVQLLCSIMKYDFFSL
jgi:hypothetical protein